MQAKSKYNAYQLVATPITWGDLKKAIADFPDDAHIVWINQFRQSLYERSPDDVESNERIIGFQ